LSLTSLHFFVCFQLVFNARKAWNFSPFLFLFLRNAFFCVFGIVSNHHAFADEQRRFATHFSKVSNFSSSVQSVHHICARTQITTQQFPLSLSFFFFFFVDYFFYYSRILATATDLFKPPSSPSVLCQLLIIDPVSLFS
jgi:hypothetical protein